VQHIVLQDSIVKNINNNLLSVLAGGLRNSWFHDVNIDEPRVIDGVAIKTTDTTDFQDLPINGSIISVGAPYGWKGRYSTLITTLNHASKVSNYMTVDCNHYAVLEILKNDDNTSVLRMTSGVLA